MALHHAEPNGTAFDADAVVELRVAPCDRQRIVAARVVEDDELEVGVGLAQDAVDAVGEEVPAILHGNHHRDEGHAAHGHHAASGGNN